MKKNRLEVVITARPSWARVKSIVEQYAILATKENIAISLVGPSVSQRYGDIRNQIPSGINVHSFPTLHDSDDLANVALGCLDGGIALARHWSSDQPDCVLIVADRTETLGVALTASVMQIPLIHLQGGEISGSIDDKIRDANSKLADLHLTTNTASQTSLINLGEKIENIHIVGCPSIDLIYENRNKTFEVLESIELGGVGANFRLSEKFGIVMFHPDTLDTEENLRWVNTLIEVLDRSALKWFWFWPNPDHGNSDISKAIRTARENEKLKNVRFVINIRPELFNQLAKQAKIMLGNSSFGIREASYLGLPVINIGQRQSGREKHINVLDVIHPPEIDYFQSLVAQKINSGNSSSSTLYGDGLAGERAAKIIYNWVPKIKSRS